MYQKSILNFDCVFIDLENSIFSINVFKHEIIFARLVTITIFQQNINRITISIIFISNHILIINNYNVIL